MPTIFELSCRACAAKEKYSASVLIALSHDGAPTSLPHPGEEYAAEALGTSLAQLKAAGRLRTGHPFLCRACGSITISHESTAHCESCSTTTALRVGGPRELGCGWLLLGLVGTFFAIRSKAFSLAAAAFIGSLAWFALSYLQRRRYEALVASLECWSCGKRTLHEEAVGRS